MKSWASSADHGYQVDTIDEVTHTEEDLDNEPRTIKYWVLVNFYCIFFKLGINTAMILTQYMWEANTYQKILRAKKHPNKYLYIVQNWFNPELWNKAWNIYWENIWFK